MCDESAEENEYYADYPKIENAWLYIAIDIRDMTTAKIGLTTNANPLKRLSQGKTYNPFLMMFTTYELSRCTFGISKEELSDIESYLHGKGTFGGAIRHLSSGRKSEWFHIHPDRAENQVDMLITKRGFSVDGEYLFATGVGYKKYGEIMPERMRKIKTIFRPIPKEFINKATSVGIKPDQYKNYVEFLEEFHARDPDGKIYL
ncbi:hypothetical protein ACPUEJ_20070 [Vibrio tubiashii]|uniref:hypothetical protein n=1 Tax=Vibrio tubiashii TaxID=29498 RepID=UPI003CE5144E